MNDFELNHGLGLLADEAEPAAVDVYDVIAKAKARTRNRRATAATALATVTLAGAMIAAISLGTGQQSSTVGSPPVSRTTIAWSPPAGPTMTEDAVNDDQMAVFTEQLAEVWPSLLPQGVTVGNPGEFMDEIFDPLEFRGFRTTIPPDSTTYIAVAELSDSLGANTLMIEVTKVGPHDWPFASMDDSEPDSTHTLPDGTRVDIRTLGTPGYHRAAQVVRPDGTAIEISVNNGMDVTGTPHGRPGFILDTEDLLKLAKTFSYS
jgi:hypothetical protein